MRKARVGLGLVGLLAALTVTFTSCANVETPGASPSPSVSVSPAPSPTPSSTPPATPATWRRIASLPLGHWAEAAVWDGREVLVFGRKQLWTEPYCRYVAFAYSPSNDTWRRLPGAPGPAGCLEGGDRVVWTGTEALLWGVTNTSYNPETNTWRKLPRPPAGFGGPSVIAWTGTQMIGWGGGCCGGAESTGAVYTPATNSWRRLPRSPLSARHTTAVWTGTELIIAGGEGPDLEMSPIYDDAAAYDPATRTWRSIAPMPTPRYASTAWWDGTEAFFVGGRRRMGPDWTYGLIPRGVAYDPATDRWHRIAPMEEPRQHEASVWTGQELLVWGGIGEGGTIPAHGEFYDPAADEWAPLPRSPLRARLLRWSPYVWTGSEMLMWGGDDARTEEILSDGAALTPAS
jgi:N-acetylneuraminic acid mutarotase